MTNNGKICKLIRICKLTSSFFGLPLMYVGVAILACAFFADRISNTLLIISIILEIIGAVVHYAKIKENRE